MPRIAFNIFSKLKITYLFKLFFIPSLILQTSFLRTWLLQTKSVQIGTPPEVIHTLGGGKEPLRSGFMRCEFSPQEEEENRGREEEGRGFCVKEELFFLAQKPLFQMHRRLLQVLCMILIKEQVKFLSYLGIYSQNLNPKWKRYFNSLFLFLQVFN